MLTSSLQVSTALVTCLLDLEQGVEEFFAVVKGVGDVLAGCWSWVLVPKRRSHLLANAHGLHRGVSAIAVLGKVLTCPLLLRQVRMVPDVLKTFGGAADAVLLWGIMAVCMAMRRWMVFFADFPRFSRSSGLSRS